MSKRSIITASIIALAAPIAASGETSIEGAVTLGLSYVFLRFPCKKEAAARHFLYAGQRRRLDRVGLGL